MKIFFHRWFVFKSFFWVLMIWNEANSCIHEILQNIYTLVSIVLTSRLMNLRTKHCLIILNLYMELLFRANILHCNNSIDISLTLSYTDRVSILSCVRYASDLHHHHYTLMRMVIRLGVRVAEAIHVIIWLRVSLSLEYHHQTAFWIRWFIFDRRPLLPSRLMCNHVRHRLRA